MHVATVVGRVWATQKEQSLEGLRLLVVEPYVRGRQPDAGEAETMVAVDPIGADVGERVLVVHGRAARHAIGKGHDIGFQTAIAGIIDAVELTGGERLGQTADGDSSPANPNERDHS